jgi:hypothetical integral membrane protein (TIGR02206 family)
MERYFSRDWDGPAFELFGTGHLICIGIVIAANLFLLARGRQLSEQTGLWLRYSLAAILVTNETIWHLWNLSAGFWTIQTMLPLHLCSLLVWLCAVMLVTGSYRIYEFAYLLGVGGALQALITPDAGVYGFPHFRAFQTQISHGSIITSAILMTTVVGYRPTWGSVGRVLVGINLYMVLVGLVNWLIGSNYLFIARKPDTASLIDLLGPWPYYIIWIEVIGIVTILLLYAPFAVLDARRIRTQRA